MRKWTKSDSAMTWISNKKMLANSSNIRNVKCAGSTAKISDNWLPMSFFLWWLQTKWKQKNLSSQFFLSRPIQPKALLKRINCTRSCNRMKLHTFILITRFFGHVLELSLKGIMRSWFSWFGWPQLCNAQWALRKCYFRAWPCQTTVADNNWMLS